MSSIVSDQGDTGNNWALALATRRDWLESCWLKLICDKASDIGNAFPIPGSLAVGGPDS